MKHALFLLLLSLLAAAPAAAQPSDADVQEARRLFDEGVAAIQSEDYATALDDFTRSQDLNPRPVTMYNIGMCQRALTDFPGAYVTLQTYLAEAQDNSASRIEAAQRVVQELDTVLARVMVRSAPSDAEVLVDGASVGTGSVLEPLRLLAGTHVFEARLHGYRSAREVVDVRAGEAVDVLLTLQPLPEDETEDVGTAAGEGGIETKWWFWTIIGAVVVGGAVTAGVLLAPEEERLPADWTIPGD
jgi:hypothetical protein